MADPRQRRGLDRWLSPSRLFAGIAIAVVATLLIAPLPPADDRTGALTTYSAGPNGARGLHDILDRFGLPVTRRLEPMREPLDARATYVVLDPSLPLTALEVHHLLEAVRAGAGLLVVPAIGSRLADSIGVRREVVLPARRAPGDSVGPVLDDTSSSLGPGWVRHVLRRAARDGDSAAAFVPSTSESVLLWLETRRGRQPMVVATPYGQGRMVIAADADLFRNVVLRRNDGAVRAIRFVEWLHVGADRPIVFDEYHHGHGRQANVLRETRSALTRTASGRTLLQISVAGLLLLLAVGVRPVRPRPRTRIERRSPLEHVDALSRAYAAVHATQRATRLLVRGLRRRHGAGRAPADEVDYLHTIAERHPHVAGDAARVADVIGGSKPGADTGAAILRIERALHG